MAHSEKQFYFIRHGETDWNLQSRMQGRTDIPLNHTGRQQASTAAQNLASLNITKIISSPLVRAKETAQIINNSLQKDILYHTDLQERHFGLIEGLTVDIIQSRPPQELFHDIMEDNGYMLPLQAETLQEFDKRVLGTVLNFFNHHLNETLLLVAHGGVFTSLTRQFLQQNIHSNNAAPYCFSCHNEIWSLKPIT